MIQAKLLLSGAKVPTKAHPEDAGFDLFAAERQVIFPGQAKGIRTGIALAIPMGFYGQVFGRSGLAFKKSIFPIGGVIDCSYRGEVLVKLFNGALESNGEPLEINPGDAIAQIVIIRISDDNVIHVVDSLSETLRGQSGFGSSG